MPSFDPAVLNKPTPKKPPAPPLQPLGAATFAGMDRSDYPGDEVMRSLVRTTNLNWTGFYLTPSPSLGPGKNISWMAKHDFLRGLGFGLAPVYVGRQVPGIPNADTRMTPDNGVIDGLEAIALANKAGFGQGTVVYLDFENGPPVTNTLVSYFISWASALRSTGKFLPGVYVNSSIATQLSGFVPDAVIWSINLGKIAGKLFKTPFPQPHPSQSGTARATHWQLKQHTNIEFTDLSGRKRQLTNVDLSSSLVSDPSVRARF